MNNHEFFIIPLIVIIVAIQVTVFVFAIRKIKHLRELIPNVRVFKIVTGFIHEEELKIISPSDALRKLESLPTIEANVDNMITPIKKDPVIVEEEDDETEYEYEEDTDIEDEDDF